MRKSAVALSIVVGHAAGVAMAAEPVPCEEMLKDLRAAIAGATLSDADKAKVNDLEGQGLERCKADDDVGADDLFTQAMQILGK